MANHKLPVTGGLSKFQISTSEFPRTTMELHSPKIFEVSKRAVVYISNALALEEREEAGKTHLVHIDCLAAYNEIADLTGTRNSPVDEYICTSPLTQLSRSLKMQKLATQYKILAEIIKSEESYLDEPKERKNKDLTVLRFYLQQLIST